MRITRRDTLKLGVATAVAAALPWRLALAQTGELVHKAIPSSGKSLPIIGIGTARRYDVGESDAERAPLREVLAQFTKLGGRVVDTAPTYGRAEQVSGELVRAIGNREQMFIATKVSHPAVTCAIPGTAKMAYLLDNLGAARGRLPDAAMRARMQAFFDSV